MDDLKALREKIRWRARRGLLEIDLFFQRFAANRLDSLTEAQLLDLEDLLRCDDHELWAMLSGRQECTVERWKETIALLCQGGNEVPTEAPHV